MKGTGSPTTNAVSLRRQAGRSRWLLRRGSCRTSGLERLLATAFVVSRQVLSVSGTSSKPWSCSDATGLDVSMRIVGEILGTDDEFGIGPRRSCSATRCLRGSSAGNPRSGSRRSSVLAGEAVCLCEPVVDSGDRLLPWRDPVREERAQKRVVVDPAATGARARRGRRCRLRAVRRVRVAVAVRVAPRRVCAFFELPATPWARLRCAPSAAALVNVLPHSGQVTALLAAGSGVLVLFVVRLRRGRTSCSGHRDHAPPGGVGTVVSAPIVGVIRNPTAQQPTHPVDNRLAIDLLRTGARMRVLSFASPAMLIDAGKAETPRA